MSEAERGEDRRRPSRGWFLLLVLPFAGLLWPPLYVRDEPRLAGIPFFYWYQFAWVVLSSVLTWLVVRAMDMRVDDER